MKDEEEENVVDEICPNCHSWLGWIEEEEICIDCGYPDFSDEEEEVFGNLDDDDE